MLQTKYNIYSTFYTSDVVLEYKSLNIFYKNSPSSWGLFTISKQLYCTLHFFHKIVWCIILYRKSFRLFVVSFTSSLVFLSKIDDFWNQLAFSTLFDSRFFNVVWFFCAFFYYLLDFRVFLLCVCVSVWFVCAKSYRMTKYLLLIIELLCVFTCVPQKRDSRTPQNSRVHNATFVLRTVRG